MIEHELGLKRRVEPVELVRCGSDNGMLILLDGFSNDFAL